jgi:hypothetical protein
MFRRLKLLGAILAVLCWLTPKTDAQVIISEFMASNSHTLADEDGDYSDWIELFNTGSSSADLTGWYLTDTTNDLRHWKFPAVKIAPGEALVVFASNKNRKTLGAPLHTNFKLTGDGEYLALVEPDGVTVASQFGPEFPVQVPDVSFGIGITLQEQELIGESAIIKCLVPSNDLPPEIWGAAEFDDTDWKPAVNGIGYPGPAPAKPETAYTDAVLKLNPLGFWHLDETTGGAGAKNVGSAGATLDLIYSVSMAFNQISLRPPQFGGFDSNNVSPKFDGIKNLAASSASPLNGRSSFGMCGWIKPGTTRLSRAGLWGQHGAIEFGFDEPTVLQLWTANGGSVRANYLYPANEWHFLAATGDGDSLRIFIDGALISEGGQPTTDYGDSTGKFAIDLGVFAATDNGFVGQIDEVALFENDLSQDEVFALYLAGSSPIRSYAELLRTDITDDVKGFGSSVYVRIPFDLAANRNFNYLTLNLNYDDGFVAYLNGVEVARKNAPVDVAFNSSATVERPGASGLQTEEINLSEWKGLLVSGKNILAIHLLNAAADDPDLLLKATMTGTVAQFPDQSTAWRYFTQPTPGEINGPGATDLGPLVYQSDFAPQFPRDADDISVTAHVRATFAAINSVSLTYRIGTNITETTLAMSDDGQHQDRAAGDGVFGAVIPANVAKNGQMVRWFITATDSAGHVTRWPSYTDKKNSPQYLGTMVIDTAVQSALPVLYWFVEKPSAADNTTGTRCAVYFNGVLYDNVFVGEHGQSSLGFPKKSYNFNFNTGYHFAYTNKATVGKFNLITTWADKAHVRNILSYDTFHDAGSPYHLAFAVRVQRNGAFFSDAHFVEDGDSDFLSRIGLDSHGALYKMYSTFDSATSNVEKKSREFEGNTDLANFLAGLRLSGTNKAAYIYDNVNIPEVVDYLAAMIITGNVDCCHKNYYFYRDSEGTGEWQMLPWDVDLSFGRNWTSALNYFDDAVYYNNPLYIGNNNTLPIALFALPAVNSMYLRRIRTLMDELLQPKSTPVEDLKYEKRMDQLFEAISPDAALDYAKWGSWGNRQTMPQAIASLRTNYFPKRRDYLYKLTTIPAAQATNALVLFDTFEFNPASANQAEEFLSLTNTNSFAVDISGWRLDGGVQHTFHPGTVLPSKGKIYVSPDVTAFRGRSAAPKGKQGLFIQGNYKGQLSARGETVLLWDKAGQLVTSMSYPGQPSAGQQWLRIVELMYAPPAPEAGSPFLREDFEYIALKNTGTQALNLGGVHFTNGISFQFATGAASYLAPGATIYLAKNVDAFKSRYGNALAVAGPFFGQLGNSGEAVELDDAVGEKILEFKFQDWYPATAGQGYSLVIQNEAADYTTWDMQTSWAPSALPFGSPAAEDWDLWIQNYFDANEQAQQEISGASADPDGDGMTNQQEFVAGTNPRDPNNRLAAVLVKATTGLELRFRAQPGKSYSIISADALPAGTWKKLQDVTPSTAARDLAIPVTNEGSRFLQITTPAIK